MGVGRPVDIFESVERGIDMFDCVIPTRFGRNGRAFVKEGEINLRNAKFAKDQSPLDVNGDSLVNIQDVVILVNMVLEVLEPDSCQIEFGDMNNDGINNILDVIQVVNLILDN